MDKILSKKKSNLIIAGAFFVLTVGVLLVLSQIQDLPQVLKQTIDLGTSVKPETFTELYFENHLQLPQNVKAKQTYFFAFTIHNLEKHDILYPYTISLVNNNLQEIIANNSVYVKNNDYKTVTESFTMPPAAGRSAIVVTLLNKKQQIDFLVNLVTTKVSSDKQKLIMEDCSKSGAYGV